MCYLLAGCPLQCHQFPLFVWFSGVVALAFYHNLLSNGSVQPSVKVLAGQANRREANQPSHMWNIVYVCIVIIMASIWKCTKY